MNLEKIIVLLCIIIIFLVVYKNIYMNERFEQIDICDYDSPDPSMFCKSIQKGCTDLMHNNIDLNKNIDTNCAKLPTDTRDMINTAINCDNMTDKVVMNNYVQTEVCSQIKNFPATLPPKDEPIVSTVVPIDTNNKDSQFFEYFVNGKNGLYPF